MASKKSYEGFSRSYDGDATSLERDATGTPRKTNSWFFGIFPWFQHAIYRFRNREVQKCR